MTRPSSELRRMVIDRAETRCEYCLMPQDLVATAHQIDHIISEKHGGPTTAENLALSCMICNSRKGSDIAARDPNTDLVTMLFNPRMDIWRDHFRLQGELIEGLTEIGRATAAFLQFNSPERTIERHTLHNAGFAIDAHLIRKPR